MTSGIFEAIGGAFSGFFNIFETGITGIIGMFFSEGQITDLGQLVLLGLGVGLFYTVFRLIRRLVKLKG